MYIQQEKKQKICRGTKSINEEGVMSEILNVVYDLKSNDKKIRYKALDQIMEISRSNEINQKKELLKILHHQAKSADWNERYISMYATSRFMWGSGSFEDFKETYYSVLKLLEDEDGRVRIAAFNALEHFRGFFIAFAFGGLDHFDKNETVKLWLDSLILLWDKTKVLEEGKRQCFMMKCVDTLFRPDMEGYLNRGYYRKYMEIWDRLQELEKEYNEGKH